MAYPRNIHLFNCDRTYSLGAVEDWLRGAKRGFVDFSIKQHYFTLPQMSEMSNVTIPALEIDLAVFVVHAHESRLSINEDNAGIGYAKIYRALQQRTGVIIVIGGDDNYKDEDEEDREVISRWAKRKVSSQFSEEYMDGRKSFIFSWDKKHREIHEEALLHFLDPNKKGKKFEYQPPKRKLPPQQLPPRGPEQSDRYRGASYDQQTGERKTPQETKPKQRQDLQDPLQGGCTFGNKKSECGYPGAPQQKPDIQVTGGRKKPQATRPQHQTGIKHPLQRDVNFEEEEKKNPPLPGNTKIVVHKVTVLTSYLTAMHSGNVSLHIEPDLSVLGWNTKLDAVSTITEYIQRHRDQLNLDENPDVLNAKAQDLITYLTRNLLKYCVLVVDAEKVNAVAHDEEDSHLKLFEAAEKHVEAKIIVAVCYPPSVCEDGEMTLKRLIKSEFKDPSKAVVVSFKNGQLQVEGDDLIFLLTSAFSEAKFYPQQSHTSSSQHSFGLGTSQPYAEVNSRTGLSQGFHNQTASSSNRQYAPQLQAAATANQPFYQPAGHFNYRLLLPPLKAIMVLTRLHNGRISNRREHVEYWMPGFIVPDPMERYLLNNAGKKDVVNLAILYERGQLVPLVDEKIDRQQFIKVELDEFIVLETRLKNGTISLEKQHVVFHRQGYEVPKDVRLRLEEDYNNTKDAKLFVISDSEDNFRCIVIVGAFQYFKSYVKTKVGKLI